MDVVLLEIIVPYLSIPSLVTVCGAKKEWWERRRRWLRERREEALATVAGVGSTAGDHEVGEEGLATHHAVVLATAATMLPQLAVKGDHYVRVGTLTVHSGAAEAAALASSPPNTPATQATASAPLRYDASPVAGADRVQLQRMEGEEGTSLAFLAATLDGRAYGWASDDQGNQVIVQSSHRRVFVETSRSVDERALQDLLSGLRTVKLVDAYRTVTERGTADAIVSDWFVHIAHIPFIVHIHLERRW
jgi:hypothetical protein